MGFSQVPSRPNVCSVVCCLLFVVCCVTKPRFGPDCLTSHGDVCPLWGLPSYMQGLSLSQSTQKFGLWAYYHGLVYLQDNNLRLMKLHVGLITKQSVFSLRKLRMGK